MIRLVGFALWPPSSFFFFQSRLLFGFSLVRLCVQVVSRSRVELGLGVGGGCGEEEDVCRRFW